MSGGKCAWYRQSYRGTEDRGMNPWTVLGSKAIYENPWIRVREDAVLRPDGKPGIYGVIEIPPSVVVLALDEADHVALVGQWRYTRNKYSWELPLGGAHAGETDMQTVAARELREETGVQAAQWRFLGTVEACIGVTTDTQWIYVATQLSKLQSAPDPEEKLQVKWVPFPAALEMVLRGEIVEGASMTAILKFDAMRRMGR